MGKPYDPVTARKMARIVRADFEDWLALRRRELADLYTNLQTEIEDDAYDDELAEPLPEELAELDEDFSR